MNNCKIIFIAVLFISFVGGCDTHYVSSFDGVTIEFENIGEGSPTLVFIHGWCCDRNYWKYQKEYFSTKYNLILIDLAGHGGSSNNRTEWSMEAYGQDILSVINELKSDNIILIGHSAGAFAAMAGAVLLKDKVIGVIGVDGLRISYDGYLEKRFDEEYYKRIKENYADGFASKIKASVPRWFPEDSDTNLIKWIADDMSKTPKDIAVPAAQAYYRYRNGGLQEALKLIGHRIPIIEINAIDRYSIAVDHVRQYAPLFNVVSMNGVGHFLMMENPVEFNEVLEKSIQVIINR